MGTAGYMAPEQIRGDAVDHRADIFGCGATLYEMLSGARAFQGDTSVELLCAMLKEDPPPLPGDAPPLLRRVIGRCLEKDPGRRFQSAADLAFALESSAEPAAAPARNDPPSRRRLLIGTASVAAAAAAFFLGNKVGRTAPPGFRRLTFRRGSAISGRFAPDGQVVVYDAAWEGQPPRIFSTRLNSPESRALEIPPARLLAVSRTGELAVKLEKGSTLARVSLAGGAVREVLRNILWADWSPNGADFMVVRQFGQKQRIEFPVGKTWYQTEDQILQACVSPDARHIAFYERPRGGTDEVSVNVVDASGNKRTLVANWYFNLGMVWAPSGKEVWFCSTDGSEVPSIRAVDLDGKIRPIFRMTVAAGISDLAPGGRALFTGSVWRSAMMCRAPGAETERDLSWLDFSEAVDLSADGATILFNETHEAAIASRHLSIPCIRRVDGSPAIRLGEGRALALSPDAQWAAVAVERSPRQLTLLPTGPGEARVLQAAHFTYYDARWFPDGKRLLVWGNEDGRLWRHFVQNVEGGPLHAVTAEGSSQEAAVSPDGEWVAAYSGPGVFLFPVDGSEPQPVKGYTAGMRPVAWTEDGMSLYLRRGNVVELVSLKTGKGEPWKDLTPADPAGVTRVGRLSMTPDAQAWVYSYERDQSDLYLADGLG
jgi:Tol biopolymer transport system component